MYCAQLLKRAPQRKCLVIVLCALGISACSPLQSLIPESEATIAEQWQSTAYAVESAPQALWLADFADAELNRLVDEALSNNLNLRAARARLEQSMAKAKVSSGELWPQLQASLDIGRRKQLSSIANTRSASLNMSWDLDIWGRLDHRVKAAVLDAAAEQARVQQQARELAAEIAKAWFDLAEAQQQLALVDSRISNLQSYLQIIQLGYQQGLNESLDIYLARSDLANEQARRASGKQNMSAQQRRLELLLGRNASAELVSKARLVALDNPVPAGQPSQLLLRRSDLHAALLRLQSAGERADSAYKSRFASFKLTTSLGSSSDELQTLLRTDTLIWSLFAGVSQPIFNAGMLKAAEAQARAAEREQQALYVAAVQEALGEVNAHLQDETLLRQRQKALNVAASNAALAQERAFEQYQSGLLAYISVLDAQRRAFAAQSSELESRKLLLHKRIDLYLALGGAFADESEFSTNSRENPSHVD